jgi:dTDP-glucose 4,6-dehydratase
MIENRLAVDLDHVLDRTRDFWNEVRGKRLFITGGTGFVGCWMLESFAWANERLALGAKAVVLSRHPGSFVRKMPHLAANPAISLLRGDVKSFRHPPGEFRYIIHAAMETNSALNYPLPLDYFDTAVSGIRRVADFARLNSSSSLLFISSGAIYGRQPFDMPTIDEEYPGAPQLTETKYSYGHSERAAEFLCQAYSEQFGIDVKIARCFTFSGPFLPLRSGFAIGNFVGDALEGKSIHINGDGTPYRSYLYAADLAIWLWSILFRGAKCRPYNVGSENALSILELGQTVQEVAGLGGEIKVDHQPTSGRPVERYVPSTQRAWRELGLQEWIPLQEGIKRMIIWNREMSGD